MDKNCSLPEEKILDYIHKWGTSSSYAIPSSNYCIFSTPSVEGFIGYKQQFKCAAALGDPICAEEDKPALAKAFDLFCKKQNWEPMYVIASKSFTNWSIEHFGGAKIEFGDELFLNPHEHPITGTKGRSLRNKINHSLRHDIKTKEYVDADPELESKLNTVATAWLGKRKGLQIYLSKVSLFEERAGKRWFYAYKDNSIWGVLLLTKIGLKDGWVVQLLMAHPTAPIGTSEQLLAFAIDTLKQENCAFLTFGAAQSNLLGEVSGLGKITEIAARKLFYLAQNTFRLDKRRRYWKKFHPKSDPSYLIFRSNKLKIKHILSLIKCLNIEIKI